MLILIVEDNEDSRKLLMKQLRAYDYNVISTANGVEALQEALSQAPDIIISDIMMPEMDGFQLCAECKQNDDLKDIPFVFYSATYTAEEDEKLALSMGAVSFIRKPTEPDVFARIISEIVENAKSSAPTPLAAAPFKPALFINEYTKRVVAKLEDKVVQLATEITEHNKAEEALKFRAEMLDRATDSITVSDLDGNIVYVNETACLARGYSKEEFMGMTTFDLVNSENTRKFHERVEEIQKKGRIIFETEIFHKDGAVIPVEMHSQIIEVDGRKLVLNVISDITERKKAENEKAQMEQQLHQNQRLESVGRLAGGVAHDLNNMLTPILGFGELLQVKTNSDEERREYLEEIMKAGRRARDLVRQLLAFSRKQTLEFKTIDLNILLKDFEKLLRSTIREDINIRLIPAESLPLIHGDVGQVEQVVMNLVVNAQDAMPDGGVLTIETTLVELDESYAAEHAEVTPGPYIMLAVSDTGHGMDAEISKHIFEPFFTTKDKDKGTGLGLSTVYGIVKQHGGNIWVYSEPGKGTTFKVYLPVSRETLIEKETEEKKDTVTHGSETVLLAEDDEIVRKLAMTVLEQNGYTVITANNGAEALLALESHDGPVHLLLTDIVMPEMNGRELFNTIVEKYPNLKVLYMSGYTYDVIAHRGVLDEGVAFIQKPFAIHDLAVKIREVLD